MRNSLAAISARYVNRMPWDDDGFALIAVTMWAIASKLVFLFLTQNESDLPSRGFSNVVDYKAFPESRRLEMREAARRMFYVGYENYMQFAFPKDELDPIHCVGRGPDIDQ